MMQHLQPIPRPSLLLLYIVHATAKQSSVSTGLTQLFFKAHECYDNKHTS